MPKGWRGRKVVVTVTITASGATETAIRWHYAPPSDRCSSTIVEEVALTDALLDLAHRRLTEERRLWQRAKLPEQEPYAAPLLAVGTVDPDVTAIRPWGGRPPPYRGLILADDDTPLMPPAPSVKR